MVYPPTMKNGEIADSFATFQTQVQWGDMDAAQHVNNIVYLRWLESARLELFLKLNSGTLDFKEIAPILAWHDCKYIFPVTYPDDVVVTYDVAHIQEYKIACLGKVYSQTNERLVAISNSVLVAYDYRSLKKIEIPASWIDQLVQFYGEGVLKKE